MKKIITILLFVSAAFIACKDKSGETEQALAAPDTTATAIVATDTSAAEFTKVGRSVFYKYAVDSIDLNTAHDMIDLYQGRRLAQIEATEHIKDSKSVWFDIDKMEEIVAKIKKNKGTGIRFYFGIYPNGGMYPRMTSIVMIGTQKAANGKDYDAIFPDPSAPTQTTASGTIHPAGTGLDPYNHGNLCPGGSNCP